MTARLAAVAAGAVTVVLAVAACGSDPLPGGPSSQRVAVRPAGSVEGAPLGYVEYLPPGYGDGTPRPLLLALHGSGENGDGSELALDRLFVNGIPALLQADDWPEGRPFVVVAPQYGGVDCRLADDIESFLRFAVEHYDVDERRVYLTGLSCGAIGAWEYVAKHGDEAIAAAALVAGRATHAFTDAGCELGRVPVWAFHGAADDVLHVRAVARPIERLEECTDPPAKDVRLTVYPDAGHDVWTQTYDLSAGHDVYAWLLGHTRR